MNFPHASPAFQRLNPHLFTLGGVGAVEAAQPEPAPAPALDRGQRQREGRPARVEVCLVVHCRRPLDDDNLSGALKPIRDAIAETIGLDDADPSLTFHCLQTPTRGPEGVHVLIQSIP